MIKRLAKTYQRSSYESIPQQGEHENDHTVNSASSNSQHPNRRPYCIAGGFLLLVSLALYSPTAVFHLTDYIPTEQDREIANAYDMPPSMSLFRRIKHAQRLADMSATWSAKDHPKVISKITKKHGGAAKHYVDIPDGCEATVMMVRHCEKGSIREHCNYMGFERSVYLASLFGDSHQERWPLPTYLFAQSPEGRHNKHKMNFREVETVGPLANKTGITVDTSYDSHSVHQLAKEILTFLHTGNMCGKLTVISWKHSEISHLARRLGCGPLQGCPMDYRGKSFDDVWQVRFVHRKMDHSDQKNLRLPKKAEWRVYGSVQPEGFDPLAVSKAFGDYPIEGAATGGRWQNRDTAYPERKDRRSTNGWKSTRVGFEDETVATKQP